MSLASSAAFISRAAPRVSDMRTIIAQTSLLTPVHRGALLRLETLHFAAVMVYDAATLVAFGVLMARV